MYRHASLKLTTILLHPDQLVQPSLTETNLKHRQHLQLEIIKNLASEKTVLLNFFYLSRFQLPLRGDLSIRYASPLKTLQPEVLIQNVYLSKVCKSKTSFKVEGKRYT